MDQSYDVAQRIMRTLRASGHRALLAGGAVRDRLMGRPSKDFDIATSALPDQVQALFPRHEAVGAKFGVILVIEDGTGYEVTTFRTDLSYPDGRHPEGVAFTTAEADAARRDFTVNGMFLDPETGGILDWVGGQEDLRRKVIRCIGDARARFEEDKLRIVRAVRFAAELGFTIDPATQEAIREVAPRIAGQVAWERIAVELTKLLVSPGRRRGVELLDELGLAAALLPELLPMKGCAQPPEFHPEGDVWVHTLLTLEKLEDPSPELAWAALLHDIGKPPTFSHAPGDRIRFNRHEAESARMAVDLCARLKFSNDMTERVRALVADHMRIMYVQEMRVSTLKRTLRDPLFTDHMALHKADCLASHGKLDEYAFCLDQKKAFEKEGLEAALKPRPLLNGEDLIALGYRPGPAFKAILTAVENEQLEGRLADLDSARAFVLAAYPKTS